MRLMKFGKFTICCLSALSLTALVSCSDRRPRTFSERTKRDTSNDYIIQVVEDTEPDTETAPSEPWDFNGQIVIFFGEGFNSEDFINETMELIKEHYGLTTEKDLNFIVPLVYPDDLKDGRITSAASITDKLTSGYIIIGAPVDTDLMTTKLSDDYYGHINYPVISLLPSNTSDRNILGQEASCTLILQYGKKIQGLPLQELGRHLIINSINLITGMHKEFGYKANFNIGAELVIPAQYICGDTYTAEAYIDPVMNIPSINHFVFK